MPTWFHEGLATTAERTWGIEDQARVLRERAFVSHASLDEVKELLESHDGSRCRRLCVGGRVRARPDQCAWTVRTRRHHEANRRRRILRQRVRQVTRQSVADAEAAFWDAQSLLVAMGAVPYDLVGPLDDRDADRACGHHPAAPEERRVAEALGR